LQPSSFTLTTIPPSRFYSKAPKPAQRGQNTEAYICALEGEVKVLHQENEELAAHAVMAFDQVRGLKSHLNNKAFRSKRRKLNTDSRWLNSEVALAQCEQEEADAEKEAACKQARADEKQAEAKERQQQRENRNPNEPFVGTLNSQKKAELQDVAFALGLEMEGKVDDLKSRINAHFNEHEDLRTSPRFVGLFPQLARQARRLPPASLADPALLQRLHDIINTATPSANHQYTFDTYIQQDDTPYLTIPYTISPASQPPARPLNEPS
jgi:hypothetical protein